MGLIELNLDWTIVMDSNLFKFIGASADIGRGVLKICKDVNRLMFWFSKNYDRAMHVQVQNPCFEIDLEIDMIGPKTYQYEIFLERLGEERREHLYQQFLAIYEDWLPTRDTVTLWQRNFDEYFGRDSFAFEEVKLLDVDVVNGDTAKKESESILDLAVILESTMKKRASIFSLSIRDNRLLGAYRLHTIFDMDNYSGQKGIPEQLSNKMELWTGNDLWFLERFDFVKRRMELILACLNEWFPPFSFHEMITAMADPRCLIKYQKKE